MGTILNVIIIDIIYNKKKQPIKARAEHVLANTREGGVRRATRRAHENVPADRSLPSIWPELAVAFHLRDSHLV